MEETEQRDSGVKRRRVQFLESGKSRESRHKAVVEELTRLERRIFPKHESMAGSFDKELQKRNVGVMYSLEDDFCDYGDEEQVHSGDDGRRAVAGYIMYSCTSVLASITKLAVRESCRRQGYAQALLEAAMDKVRSKRVLSVNLHVDPLRTPALSLYRKLGFQVDTLVHSYYAPNRDAYRMILTFDYDS